jgi:hypothetical protein
MFTKKSVDILDKSVFERGNLVTVEKFQKDSRGYFLVHIFNGIVDGVSDDYLTLQTLQGKQTISIEAIEDSPRLSSSIHHKFKIVGISRFVSGQEPQ